MSKTQAKRTAREQHLTKAERDAAQGASGKRQISVRTYNHITDLAKAFVKAEQGEEESREQRMLRMTALFESVREAKLSLQSPFHFSFVVGLMHTMYPSEKKYVVQAEAEDGSKLAKLDKSIASKQAPRSYRIWYGAGTTVAKHLQGGLRGCMLQKKRTPEQIAAAKKREAEAEKVHHGFKLLCNKAVEAVAGKVKAFLHAKGIDKLSAAERRDLKAAIAAAL